jgi:uncharacterized protein (UPF0333 family)
MVKIFGKKGQAALEFLTTYGWAFMVILVMIGALAYFGVLSPKNLVPDSCIAGAGFNCRDFQVGDSTVKLSITNSLGSQIYVSHLVVQLNGVNANACTINTVAMTPTNNVTVADGANIAIDGCTFVARPTVGSKVKLSYSFDYQTAEGVYSHPMTGTVTAKVADN